jgi:hypothetical protein
MKTRMFLAAAFVVGFAAPAGALDTTRGTTAGTTATQKSTALKGKTGSKVTGVTGIATAGVMELTSQECKGMGGTVSGTPAGDPKCKTAEMCFTTDKHGVIRSACIDEVAAD